MANRGSLITLQQEPWVYVFMRRIKNDRLAVTVEFGGSTLGEVYRSTTELGKRKYFYAIFRWKEGKNGLERTDDIEGGPFMTRREAAEACARRELITRGKLPPEKK